MMLHLLLQKYNQIKNKNFVFKTKYLNCARDDIDATINYEIVHCNEMSIEKIIAFKTCWLRDTTTGLTFNNSTLHSHGNFVICIYLKTNSNLCHLKHKLIGLYNRDEYCLLRDRTCILK